MAIECLAGGALRAAHLLTLAGIDASSATVIHVAGRCPTWRLAARSVSARSMMRL